ncbi:Translation initiation factor eIF2B subunit delta [Entamoeba marina]
MASVLTLIAYVLFIILAPTLILLIIPIPLFFKRKFLQIIKFVIKNKYLSLTLLTISILLCLDSFIQLRRFENQKDQIAIDAPMASRITIYSNSGQESNSSGRSKTQKVIIQKDINDKQQQDKQQGKQQQGKQQQGKQQQGKQQQGKQQQSGKQQQGKQQQGKQQSGKQENQTGNALSAKELKAQKKQEKHDKKIQKKSNSQTTTSAAFDPYSLLLGSTQTYPQIKVHSDIHPSFIRFAAESSEYKCIGSTVRALRFIECVIMTIKASGLKQSTECIARIEENMKILEKVRSVSVGMNNVKKFIFMRNQDLDQTIETAQNISMNILGSQREIVSNIQKYRYISNNAVILTVNYSTLLLNVLKNAHLNNEAFSVVVVETSPFEEGALFARCLSKIGIDTTYILPSGLQQVLSSVTRVLLSASSMDGKGSLYTRSGTASVLIAARHYHIPVIVCCETYKMTAEVMRNENEICRIGTIGTMYDDIPAEFITVVVTEFGQVPASAIPAVVREQRWDSKALFGNSRKD